MLSDRRRYRLRIGIPGPLDGGPRPCQTTRSGSRDSYGLMYAIVFTILYIPGANVSLITVSSYLGGSFFVVAAQASFINRLLFLLPKMAPGVDPTKVVGTGATLLRTTFDPAHLPGILRAYMSGLRVTFAIAVGGIGVALLLSLFNGWRRSNAAATEDDEATG